MTRELNDQERKILTDHIGCHDRRPIRRDWMVYVDLRDRGLITLTQVAWAAGKFRVSTSPAGREALRQLGINL